MVQLRQLNATWAEARRAGSSRRGRERRDVAAAARHDGGSRARRRAHRARARAARAARHAVAVANWSRRLGDLRAVLVAVAASVAGGAAWKLFHVDARVRAGSSSAGSAIGCFCCCCDDAPDGDTPDRAAALPLRTRLAIFVRMLADSGRRGTTRRCSATALASASSRRCARCPAACRRAAFTTALARESALLQRASVSRVGRRRRAGARGARRRAAGAHRAFSHGARGPLGSVGDRLVWAGWLPFCSLALLASSGSAPAPVLVVTLFLVLYNAGHLALRIWGLAHGLDARAARRRVARQLRCCVAAPQIVARAAMALGGLALPLASRAFSAAPTCESPRSRAIAARPHALVFLLLAVAALLGVLLVELHGRIEGWRVALLIVLAASRSSLGGLADARTNRPDREQERPARAARGRDREARGEVPERDHDRAATIST